MERSGFFCFSNWTKDVCSTTRPHGTKARETEFNVLIKALTYFYSPEKTVFSNFERLHGVKSFVNREPAKRFPSQVLVCSRPSPGHLALGPCRQAASRGLGPGAQNCEEYSKATQTAAQISGWWPLQIYRTVTEPISSCHMKML